MEKHIEKVTCMSLFILLMVLISACNNNVVELFDIDHQKISENGYFRFMCDYEYADDKVYEITYPLNFDDNDDEKNWNVYVFDYMLDVENINKLLEKYDPALVDNGKLDVVSGQWIYVYCPQDISDQDAKSKGHFTIKYDKGLQSKRDVTSIVTYCEKGISFSYSSTPVEKKNILNKKLPNLFLFDITGDGVADICDTRLFGSGMVREQAVVYDPVNDKIYILDGFDYSYYIKGVENGKIIVIEKGPYGYNDKNITETTGTMKLEGEELVFVPDN